MLQLFGGEQMLSENSRKEWTRKIEAGVSLWCAPRCVREDKELVLLAVTKDGSNLEYASDELKNDIDVVSVAISQSLDNLKYADNNLQSLIIFKGIKVVMESRKLSDLENSCFDDEVYYLKDIDKQGDKKIK